MAFKDRLRPLLPKALAGSAEVVALRNEADRLRDERKFAEAAEYYRRYLQAKPGDFSIWVQLGNCLKDSESFAAAEVAYEEAATVNPNDADLNLQRGHLMKRQGKRIFAIEYYRKSLELDPDLASARHELVE